MPRKHTQHLPWRSRLPKVDNSQLESCIGNSQVHIDPYVLCYSSLQFRVKFCFQCEVQRVHLLAFYGLSLGFPQASVESKVRQYIGVLDRRGFSRILNCTQIWKNNKCLLKTYLRFYINRYMIWCNGLTYALSLKTSQGGVQSLHCSIRCLTYSSQG